MTQKSKAQLLRKNQTDAERQLWRYLRNKQLAGFKFRRQHKIGVYIVDFVCPEKSLIVELDGGQHLEQFAYDLKRTGYLQLEGYQVIRFWNNEVINELEMVLEEIIRKLEGLPSPRPSPRRGEGENQKRKA